MKDMDGLSSLQSHLGAKLGHLDRSMVATMR